ncbi:hypothetical protein CJ20_085 [Escherichia phage CJ20]|nr:hypothetical protein CJ20_085 [Escherichia phage CJ20]
MVLLLKLLRKPINWALTWTILIKIWKTSLPANLLSLNALRLLQALQSLLMMVLTTFWLAFNIRGPSGPFFIFKK